MPKVSVIIPTYNRQEYVACAIESVFKQTFHDYEIIVIDDGSTDNTQAVLLKFSGKIKSIKQINQGISITRNRGIEESKGEYIAFLDSDDYWTPEKLQEQVTILDNNPKVGIVYSRMPIINDKGEKIGMKPAGACGKNFKELLEMWGDLPTSTVMTRRECFQKTGLFDTSLGTMEDIDMWLRIAQHYDIYEIENKILAYYRRHEEQITKSRIVVYEGLVKIYTKVFKNYPEAPRDLMINRITESQYLLARAYYNEGYYKKSFKNTLAAIIRYPMLGNLFIDQKADSLLTKITILLKPYGLLGVGFFKILINGFKK